jgi:phosphotransferase system enzyme I (PtsP)
MRKQGKPLPKSIRVGAMLEVPSLIFQLPGMLQRVDFLSVGSNDLVQFLFASDRGNSRLADRYDPISPAVLRVLRDIVTNATGPASRSACAARWRATLGCDGSCRVGLPAAVDGALLGRPGQGDDPQPGPRAAPRLHGEGFGHARYSVRDKLRAFAQDHGVLI